MSHHYLSLLQKVVEHFLAVVLRNYSFLFPFSFRELVFNTQNVEAERRQHEELLYNAVHVAC